MTLTHLETSNGTEGSYSSDTISEAKPDNEITPGCRPDIMADSDRPVMIFGGQGLKETSVDLSHSPPNDPDRISWVFSTGYYNVGYTYTSRFEKQAELATNNLVVVKFSEYIARHNAKPLTENLPKDGTNIRVESDDEDIEIFGNLFPDLSNKAFARDLAEVMESVLPIALSAENKERLQNVLCKVLERRAPQINALQRVTDFLKSAQLSHADLKERYADVDKFPGKKKVDPVQFFNRVWRQEVDRGCFHTGMLRAVDEPLFRALDVERRRRKVSWSDPNFNIPTKEESQVLQMNEIYDMFGGQFSMEAIKRFFNTVSRSHYTSIALG